MFFFILVTSWLCSGTRATLSESYIVRVTNKQYMRQSISIIHNNHGRKFIFQTLENKVNIKLHVCSSYGQTCLEDSTNMIKFNINRTGSTGFLHFFPFPFYSIYSFLKFIVHTFILSFQIRWRWKSVAASNVCSEPRSILLGEQITAAMVSEFTSEIKINFW